LAQPLDRAAISGVEENRPVADLVPNPLLNQLYQYWRSKRGTRRMPRRADIDPLEIPADIWPHTMLLDVIWEGSQTSRFRYRRVGEVFWRDTPHDPTGHFIDEVLPEQAGYRQYVVGIYQEMTQRRAAMYTASSFTLEGRPEPAVTQRVSLPLSNDDETVNMVLAAHAFEHGVLTRDMALARATALTELARVILED
jgi:hypothetical protein